MLDELTAVLRSRLDLLSSDVELQARLLVGETRIHGLLLLVDAAHTVLLPARASRLEAPTGH